MVRQFESLRCRALFEVEAAGQLVEDAAVQKSLSREAAALKTLDDAPRRQKYTSGRSRKDLRQDWLIAQICRTCERLAPDPSMRSHRAVLRRALVCLRVR